MLDLLDDGTVEFVVQAIRVRDIEQSLAFYGILGFVVSEKFFTPAGARACFVEGLGVRLELVESTTGTGVGGVQHWPGFLTFDVTKIAVSLDTWLDHLHRRNGGILAITAEPANQVIGSNVISIATIEDPDGLPIDFVGFSAHFAVFRVVFAFLGRA
jgi:catechol 2,3-dioxygenase-like lactoylglutathione lyase family enzyme